MSEQREGDSKAYRVQSRKRGGAFGVNSESCKEKWEKSRYRSNRILIPGYMHPETYVT